MQETKINSSNTNLLFGLLVSSFVFQIIALGGLFIKIIRLENQIQFQTQQTFSTISQNLDEGLGVKSPAPKFALVSNANGNEVLLENYRGQKVLLFFSATTCPYCQKMYPSIKTFSELRKDIQVIMLSRGTPDENIETRELCFGIMAGQAVA